MGNRFDRLPKGVQKLVKRLANIEREQLKTLRAGYLDEEARMMALIDKGNKVTEELFNTKFAMEELGAFYPDSSDDLQAMGEYLLGEYALERIYAEESGEQYEEDLFYAGANLKQAADVLADAEYDDYLDDELDDMDEFELNSLLSGFAEERGTKPTTTKDGRVVPLFREKKGK